MYIVDYLVPPFMGCLVRLVRRVSFPEYLNRSVSSAPLVPLNILAMSSVLALSACSGGGGGSSPTSSGAAVPSESLPVSAQNLSVSSISQTEEQWGLDREYQGNSGLDRISAAGAYASGATGAGQIIGFLDTGIDADHPEFASPEGSDAPKIVYNNVSNLSANPSNAQLRHGTSVASLAAAAHGSGGVMQGVAFDAQIAMWSLNLSSDNYYSLSGPLIEQAYSDLVATGARIINNSWTLDGQYSAISKGYQANSMRSYFNISNMASSNIIHVFAAGNSGKDQVATTAALPLYFSELVGKIVAVTSVGQGGRIDDQANRCGLAQDFCLAAPGGFDGTGGFINGAGVGGGYNSVRGTSFSAAYVSGVLALMRQVFGDQLTEAQYLDRLLDTANKEGIYSDTSVYGQGLVDAEQAVTPIGGLAAPSGSGGNYWLSDTWFSSVGDGLDDFATNFSELSMVALDARGDPFSVAVGGLVRARPKRDVLDFSWGQTSQRQTISKKVSLTNYGAGSGAVSDHPVFEDNTILKGFMLRGSNMAISQLDYAVSKSDRAAINLHTVIAYDQGFASPEIAMRLSIAANNSALPSLTLGTVHDLNGLHGVEGRGAFSTQGVGQLLYVGLEKSHGLGNGWTVSGNAQYGNAKLQPREGLIQTININNMAAMEVSFEKGHSVISLVQQAYSQDAYMDIDIPVRREASGNINLSNQRFEMFNQRPVALEFREYSNDRDAQRYLKFEQKGDGSVLAQIGFEWLF